MRGTHTTLYFSSKHDADLLELYRQVGRRDFIKIMKESVRMLVRPGYDPVCIREASLAPHLSPKGDDDNESLSLVVSFSSMKDRDISSLLKTVVPGKLGLFVKNAMRMAVGPYFVLGCLLSGGDEDLNLAYRNRGLFFVQGIPPADAGAFGKTEKQAKKATKKKPVGARSSTKLNCNPPADSKAERKEERNSNSIGTLHSTPLSSQEASRDLQESTHTAKFAPSVDYDNLAKPLDSPNDGGLAVEMSDDDVLALLEGM